MRTLARFEYALGRRVGWSFGGHQIQVCPHAFLEANAFYSKEDRSLLFGYFPKKNGVGTPAPPPLVVAGDPDDEEDGLPVLPKVRPKFREMTFTCLSHDVVAHETTHALLDGLRPRFTDPSSPEQAGFHEGFADLVALLSIYSLTDVVWQILDDGGGSSTTISSSELTAEKLRDKSLLFDLAGEVGQGLNDPDPERRGALRRSISLVPGDYTKHRDYEEPHCRGRLLVAALMNAFLHIWIHRISPPRRKAQGTHIRRTAGGSSRRAPTSPTSSSPPPSAPSTMPTHRSGSGTSSALLLTADHEFRAPRTTTLKFRQTLREASAGYCITPTSKGDGSEPGVWEPPDCEVVYERVHLGSHAPRP